MKTSPELEKQLSLLTDSKYYNLAKKRGATEAYLLGTTSPESISTKFEIKGASTLVRCLTKMGLYATTNREAVRCTVAFKMEVANLAQLGIESMESLHKE